MKEKGEKLPMVKTFNEITKQFEYKNIKNKGILTSEDVKDSNSLTISFSDDIKKMNM